MWSYTNLVIHHKILKHFIPHTHENGDKHHAHAVSLGALFVYLQVLVVLTGSLYLIRLKAPQILGKASFGIQQIVDLTNAKRKENGLSSLSTNALLNQAAQTKAADMFGSNYWAHNSPSGRTPWSFISAAGYKYVYAGENLARDFTDAGSVVNSWMASSSHRSNILDKNFQEIGVAVESGNLDGREGILVVQMFGTAVSQIPTQEPLVQVVPTPQPTGTTAGKAVAKAPSSPSILPTPTSPPTPVAIAQLTNTPTQAPATVLASRQFSIARLSSLAIIGFIFLLFSLEVLISVRRTDLKVRSAVIAHLGLLGFVLLAVWYAVQGAVI